MEKSDAIAIGRRLRAVMVELGFGEAQDFARALGTVPGAVTNWMTGYNRPNIEVARRLIELIPDLSMEWLYFGDEAKIPRGLALRLDIRVKAFERGMAVPVVRPVPKPVTVRAVQRRRRRPTRSLESDTLLQEKA